MQYAMGDLVDRWTILTLKAEHGYANQQELGLVCRAAQETATELGVSMSDLRAWFVRLLALNAAIWALESDLRRGREEHLGLEEIGQRAVAIRDWNAKRIAAKNEIAMQSGHGFYEAKIAHLSTEGGKT